MAYCIMNIDKQGRAAVYGLQIEANREKDDKREFDLSDIDRERTDQNYYLKKTRSWNREITKQIKEAGVKEKKDSVVMITGVYTASPEFFEKCSREEMEKYFQDCLAFHIKEYCQGNEQRLLNAVVHLDETTPHMQVASVPIIEDEKGLHLSAKIIMGNRSTYRLRQDRFFEEVGKKYDLERGERRDPAQAKEHTTKREWQITEQEERYKDTIDKTNKALNQLDNVNQQLEQAQEQIKPKIEAYNAISEAVKERQKPTIEVAKEEVKDGFIRSHEEYFVKVPCKDEKEAETVQKEVMALYDKNFAQEALNELILAKDNDLDKKRRKQQRDLAKAKKEFENQKENMIKGIEKSKMELLRQSKAFNQLTLDDLGISSKDIKDLAKDSIAETMINETVKAVIDTLESHDYLERRPNILQQINITEEIRKSFGDRVHELLDKVREHVADKLFRKSHNKDLNISR